MSRDEIETLAVGTLVRETGKRGAAVGPRKVEAVLERGVTDSGRAFVRYYLEWATGAKRMHFVTTEGDDKVALA